MWKPELSQMEKTLHNNFHNWYSETMWTYLSVTVFIINYILKQICISNDWTADFYAN